MLETAVKTAQATSKRELLGRQAELEFTHFLSRHQGSTAYDIAKGLGWSYGKVQGVINKMKDELRFEEAVESGRAKKRIYLLMPKSSWTCKLSQYLKL
jgi:hypothetical protein